MERIASFQTQQRGPKKDQKEQKKSVDNKEKNEKEQKMCQKTEQHL